MRIRSIGFLIALLNPVTTLAQQPERAAQMPVPPESLRAAPDLRIRKDPPRASAAGVPPGISAITNVDLRRDMEAMAGHAMRGREAGTLDELRASGWVVEQLRRIGVEPAGDDGTYYQWWPMRRNRIASSSSVTLGNDALRLWRDAIVTTPTEASVDGPVVWVNEGRDADLQNVDINGKVVAAQIVMPTNAPNAAISLYAWRYARLAVNQQSATLIGRGARAVILVADSVTESAMDFMGVVSARGTYGIDSVANADAANVMETRGGSPAGRARSVPPVILVHRSMRDRLAQPGQTVAIRAKLESFLYPSVNIIGQIRGTDPALRNEYVVFSSHQDHDGVRYAINGDSVWNGADDNASVSVALLAIARAFKKQPGKRTALFIYHGAEERGLLGSRWYVSHPTVPLNSIAAVLNGDMIGRNARDSASLMGIQPPHRNSSDLVSLALDANNRTSRFLLDSIWDRPTHPEGWYFRSDHLPYARANVPAVMFSSNLHPDYHTPRDEPARIDYVKLRKMTDWMYMTGWLVANTPRKPRIDQGFKLER